MAKEYFKLDKKTNIILYGAATTGTLMLKSLCEHGYNVEAFIDKRAEEMTFNSGIPVLTIDSSELNRASIIIVAVKNVFEHSNVVNHLVDNGFRNIIYKSIDVLEGNGNYDDNKLSEAYDLIQEGKFDELEKINLICTDEKYSPRLKFFGKYTEDCVEVKVPITMIFTDKKIDNKDQDSEQPIVGFLPHIEFVDYVLGLPDGDIKKYIDFCRNSGSKIGTFELTESWTQNVLKNRSEVILRMNHAYEMDADFFERAVINVRWNSERNAFNLCSGKHRAIFLLEKGLNYLPVKMSMEDFVSWKQSLGVENTIDGNRSKYETLPEPTENPWMYGISSFNESFYFNLIRKISRKWAIENYSTKETLFDGVSIITNVYENIIIKHYFDRCNAEMIYINSLDEVNDKLLNLNNKNVCAIIQGSGYDSLIKKTSLFVRIDDDNMNEFPENEILYRGVLCGEAKCVRIVE